MKTRTLALALLALVPASAQAQRAWDAPSFMPPRPAEDIGVYVSSIADFGIQGIWRQSGTMNLGLRLGYIDTFNDGAVAVAAETWDLFIAAGETLPVDVGWTLGAGAAFNGGTVVEVPAGLTIGRTVVLEALTLQPYAHPRLGLFIGAVGDQVDLELDALFDLGVDAVLNENLKLRLAATLAGADALGIGLAFRWSRGAVVR